MLTAGGGKNRAGNTKKLPRRQYFPVHDNNRQKSCLHLLFPLLQQSPDNLPAEPATTFAPAVRHPCRFLRQQHLPTFARQAHVPAWPCTVCKRQLKAAVQNVCRTSAHVAVCAQPADIPGRFVAAETPADLPSGRRRASRTRLRPSADRCGTVKPRNDLGPAAADPAPLVWPKAMEICMQ